MGFPGGASGKEPACQSSRHKRCTFHPWVRKTPWRRKWQPTAVFLPVESQGQRSLVSYSPWRHKESDTTEAAEPAAREKQQLTYKGSPTRLATGSRGHSPSAAPVFTVTHHVCESRSQLIWCQEAPLHLVNSDQRMQGNGEARSERHRLMLQFGHVTARRKTKDVLGECRVLWNPVDLGTTGVWPCMYYCTSPCKTGPLIPVLEKYREDDM